MKEVDKWTYDNSIIVEELIEVLKKYPKEMKCIFTWESTLVQFSGENIYPGNEQILLFDADQNSYKDRYENSIRIEL
jgi:hypothetical protein